MATAERAEPKAPRRFAGKPIAIGFATFLIVGTALTAYFAARNELARQRAMDADAAAHPGETITP
jgi:hypothetical protein